MKEATINQIKKYGGYVLSTLAWAAQKRKLIVILVAAVGGIAASGTVDKVLSVASIVDQIAQ